MQEPPNDPDAQLAAAIAHEVNSPLAVVLANIELTMEVLARLQTSATRDLTTDEARAWLDEQVRDAASYLADARASAAEIQEGLARRVSPSPDRAPPRAAAAAAPSVDVASLPARVLVVDDQESVGRALERLLRGYDVLALVDPREALARITGGERFAVILCDLMMPEMTGAMLHERIRRVDVIQASRMVFVTGGATTAETRAFVARIRQPVLLKPFVVSELRDVVARIAAQTAQSTR